MVAHRPRQHRPTTGSVLTDQRAPPNDPDTRTTRQLVDIVYAHAGQPTTRVRSLPPLIRRGLGVFNPTVRELLEMQYQFAEPFIVESTKITTKLGIQPTPYDQALGETLAAYPHLT